MTVDWARARAAMAASLDTTPEIRAAFERVPRHAFIPDRVWPVALGPPLDRGSEPDRWADLVYADEAVVTQVADGRADIGLPSSSSSMPTMMARMIEAADLRPRSRVLEIGTGTGYNAALLCELVGQENVVTVEVDPTVAAQARRRLDALGYAPTVVVGDGSAAAWADFGEFDAVIATCSVVAVPPAWIAQVRTGGIVVTPWAPAPDLPSGLLARLVVGGDRAGGRFCGTSSFMRLRSQRWAGGAPHDLDAEAESVSRWEGDPRDLVLGDACLQLVMMAGPWRLGLRLADPAGEPWAWMSATDSPSWARLHDDGRIEQGGPRRLWNEAEAAFRWWTAHGCPPVTGYGLTVDTEGRQCLWLHTPDGGPWWPHPGVGALGATRSRM
ncbi:methyltransferase domain-containing protein [Streptomonospora sp. S1-112]|uniref:Protein-L-isoaspartate O-methyltransferase n=1 Tax=Streptomonospora mangrovi TaxID=2883123 RepID=A0A9X3SDH3_9ACTN|nr:methyltransferase domain-containing protein [Streptomonospora mangrovi]MDA0564808.1 methyltransferase domain-containing protein [Streptomonospora mangrovi]